MYVNHVFIWDYKIVKILIVHFTIKNNTSKTNNLYLTKIIHKKFNYGQIELLSMIYKSIWKGVKSFFIGQQTLI